MNGQGNPLPSFFKLEGEWIIEPFLFMCHSSTPPSNAVLMAMGAEFKDGGRAVGIHSHHLAAALDMDREELRDANRNGTLICLGERKTTPANGGVSATDYGFQVGDNVGSVTVESLGGEGTC